MQGYCSQVGSARADPTKYDDFNLANTNMPGHYSVPNVLPGFHRLIVEATE